jgi:sentrin-specific protease 1
MNYISLTCEKNLAPIMLDDAVIRSQVNFPDIMLDDAVKRSQVNFPEENLAPVMLDDAVKRSQVNFPDENSVKKKVRYLVHAINDKKEETIKKIFLETKESNLEDVLYVINNIEITRESFVTLNSKDWVTESHFKKGWLDGSIIDAYLSMVQKNNSHVHISSFYFYSRLKINPIDPNTLRWFKNVNLMEKILIIFPMNINNSHWTLIVINNEYKTVQHFDSFGKISEEYSKNVFDFYKWYCEKVHNVIIDEKTWCFVNEVSCAHQQNTYDCGVFMLMNAEFLSDGVLRPQTFNQADAKQFRFMIALSIMAQEINYK